MAIRARTVHEVIASAHVVDLATRDVPAAFRERPKVGTVPGLEFADLLLGARLGGPVTRKPIPGRVTLFSVWQDDAALDAWLQRAPLARRLARGWHARLEPLRAYGTWPSMPPMFEPERPVDDGEPVVVLTYGKPRLRVLHHFLKASQAAEDRAVADPAMVAGSALARPPVVATFSVWRTAGEMRAYATRAREHVEAMKGMRQHDFHHHSIFARFRPYAVSGTWDGREPIAVPATPPAERAAL
jgi:heme-degrading monooxygenase HmoA